MAGKFRRNVHRMTVAEAFQEFLLDKMADGISRDTIRAYRFMFDAAAHYWDVDMPLEEVDDRTVRRAVGEMAGTDLSRNTIRSYTATLKTFFSWCRREGLSDVDVRLFKGEESAPETYTDEELRKLLRHPKKRCQFSELRAWAIVNLLVNNGIRAASVRAIQNRDVDLDANVILLRHTKARKVQTVPLSPAIVAVLREYMRDRGGDPEEFFFPNINGDQLSAAALRSLIRRYNLSRGVDKTGIHAFRHTFARMYLVDCGGDALKLQKLLGHSTLDMTKHYVRIFNEDLIADFQQHAPLDQIQKKARKKGRD